MKLFFSLFGFGLLAGLNVRAEPQETRPASFSEILKSGGDSSPAILLERLEASALRARGLSGIGRVFPELGVEGGGRSDREKEKRNALFYYGYARYELGLSEIGELRAGLARKDLGNLSLKMARAKGLQALSIEFFKALSIQKQIELKEDDFSAADKQIGAAKKRVDAGLATESDVLEFRMHQSVLKNDLRGLKIDLDLAFRELERIGGLNFKISNLKYEISDPVESLQLDGALKSALSNSVELEKKKLERTLAVAEKLSAWGRFLPRLSAEANYGKLQETDFVESRKNSWAIVGKVTIPLFNGGSSFRKIQEKNAEADRAELLLALESTRLRQLVGSLVVRQKELSQKLKGEKENLDFTQTYFDLVVAEYRRGVKNSPDVASATDKLFEAKWRIFETWRDLSLAVIELNVVQGKEWRM